MRLDELNRAKRTLASPRADFLKLSEQLRTVGAIVDRRGGQLIRLDRTAYEGMISSFTVQYKMATGELVTEEFSASSLYDFSVQIFMMEKRRSSNSRSGLAGRLGVSCAFVSFHVIPSLSAVPRSSLLSIVTRRWTRSFRSCYSQNIMRFRQSFGSRS